MTKPNWIDRIANYLLPGIASLTPRGNAALDLVPTRKAPQISVPISRQRKTELFAQRNERRLSRVFEQIRAEEPNILKILMGSD